MTELEGLNEKLTKYNCVVALHVDIEPDTLKYNILLELSEHEGLGAGRLVLQFFDVSEVQMSEFGGGLTQFMHLNISRISAGLDRINYVIKELEHHKISFNFAFVEEL